MQFETEFTESMLERGIAQAENRVRTIKWGCPVLILVHIVLVLLKQVVLIFAIAFPLLLIPLAIHHCTGRRIWRVRKGGKLVLWLRRFHRKDLRRFPFATILRTALLGEATPLTIQDSTYRTAFVSLVSRGVLVVIGIGFASFLAGLLGTFLLMILVIGVTDLVAPQESRWIGGLALLPGMFLGWMIMSRLMQRAGYIRLRASDAESKVNRICEQVRQGRSTHALRILQCGDEFWQRTVLRGIDRADAVIIDVTEMGRNVAWELRQVRNVVPPERVVLCCAAEDGWLLPGETALMNELQDTVDLDWLQRTWRVAYELPPPLPGIVDLVASPFRQWDPIASVMWPGEMARLMSALVHALEGRGPNSPNRRTGPPPLPA